MNPLAFDFTEATFEFQPGCVASGRGTLDVASPLGPVFEFQGEYDGHGFDVVRAFMDEPRSEPGELFSPPARPLRARSCALTARTAGAMVLHGGDMQALAQPVPILGEYLANVCTVTSGVDRAPGEVVVDVHCLGRGCAGFPFPTVAGLPVPHGCGAVVRWGAHEFILRSPDEAFDAHVRACSTGTFTYRGPAEAGSDAFWDAVWPFVLLLGSALGGPIDPVGWVTRSADGSAWYEATWRRPGKAHRAACVFRPVGADRLQSSHRDVVAWVEGGLAAWSRFEPTLGLEVALLYLENSHGQAEPEIRCRDLVNAIERLLVGRMRVPNASATRTSLAEKIAQVGTSVGSPMFTPLEVVDLVKFRNRLAHDGGLVDVRVHSREEHQALADAEGWLATCCYRLLAAIFGVDVPLADVVTRGPVRRRPSQGGFLRSPFVPTPS